MKLAKPRCAHCDATSKNVKLYWSTRNLLKQPMKTWYCDHCAKIIAPGREPIEPGKIPGTIGT